MEELKFKGSVILFKRGTKAEFEQIEFTPRAGQPIFETDTKRLKVGDGVTPYDQLPYIGDVLWVQNQFEVAENDRSAIRTEMINLKEELKDYFDTELGVIADGSY